MPVLSKLGAECTVFDYSDKQLEAEKMVSEREGYSINIIKGDMSKPLPFEDESFDLIFHPVSNVYVEDVYSVWNECYRILKKGGRLLYIINRFFPVKYVSKLPDGTLLLAQDKTSRFSFMEYILIHKLLDWSYNEFLVLVS